LNQTINILNILFIINSGALNGRLSIDALNVRRLVGDNLALLVQSIATLICGIVIAMVADWKLSLVILFVIPLVGLQGYAQVKFLQGFSQDAKVDKKLAFYTFFPVQGTNISIMKCYSVVLFPINHELVFSSISTSYITYGKES